MEEYEDDIISMFGKSAKEPHRKLCVDLAEVCPLGATFGSDESSEETDFEFEREELWFTKNRPK